MATLNATNLKHGSSGSNNIVLAADGSTTISGNATCSGTATGFGGGKILQVIQTVKDDTASTSSNSEADLMSINITPASSSSKILIFIDLKIGSSTQSTDPQFFLYRGSTKVYYGANAGNRLAGFFGADEYDSYNNAQWLQKAVQANYLDSPSTASQVTYTIKWRVVDTNHTLYLNRTGNDNNTAAYHRSASSITAMEVAA